MSVEILELVWNNIKIEAQLCIDREPVLSNFLRELLLKHKNLSGILADILASKLSNTIIPFYDMKSLIEEAYRDNPDMVVYAAYDIYAVRLRDPAVNRYLVPILYFKGFHALQAYRISHWLWYQNRQVLALYLQSQISFVFGVDIHPAAYIGYSVIFDHATGIVIGETSVIENDVSILHFVTLGGRDSVTTGDRHPKVRSGAVIGAGAIILGNIEIGCYAKVGAGSVVLHSVPSYTTVVGMPAKIINDNSIDSGFGN